MNVYFKTQSRLVTIASGLLIFGTFNAYAQAVLGNTPGGSPGNAQSNASRPVPVDISALKDCVDAAKESRLLARETALLGRAHALEHADVRQYRCRIARGIDKEEAPDPQLLAAVAAAAPADIGQWSEPYTVPISGVSAVLLNNGQVLFWSYDPAHWGDPAASNSGLTYLFNPTTREGQFISTPENIWCGGHTLLSDGRVFTAGGNLRYPDPSAPAGSTGWEGDLSAYTFSPVSRTWIKQPDMKVGRWYPTATKLPNNTVVITSGYNETGNQKITDIVELFTPSAGMNGVGTIRQVATKPITGLYPFQYVIPSGQMLQAGPAFTNSYLLNTTDWSWVRTPNMLYSHPGNSNGITYVDATTAPARQLVMIAGGTTGVSNNEYMDANSPMTGWREYPKWKRARHNSNTIILPDGSLFTVGGNSQKSNYGGTLFSAELYNKTADDVSGTWSEVAPNTIPAAYHSSALLLPNGTVMLSQDDKNKTVEAAANHKVQIYSPPYLFKGARPKMGAPNTGTRGQPIAITATPATGRNIVKAVLVAPGSVTHGNDMHQRLINLPITVSGNNVSADIPAAAQLVPPGYYMLFIVDSAGVPSIAKFIRISA